MIRNINNIISVIHSIIKFIFLKIFYRKRITFALIERFSPNTSIEIRDKGEIHIGNRVRAHSGVKIRASKNGLIKIGDNVAFNYNCMLTAHKKIVIGDDCTFGPGVLVYDHDHDYRKTGKINGDSFVCDDVIIGNNCWIGSNVIILRGTILGNNCVVGAGTVLKGIYKDNAVIYNKNNIVIKDYIKEE